MWRERYFDIAREGGRYGGCCCVCVRGAQEEDGERMAAARGSRATGDGEGARNGLSVVYERVCTVFTEEAAGYGVLPPLLLCGLSLLLLLLLPLFFASFVAGLSRSLLALSPLGALLLSFRLHLCACASVYRSRGCTRAWDTAPLPPLWFSLSLSVVRGVVSH